MTFSIKIELYNQRTYGDATVSVIFCFTTHEYITRFSNVIIAQQIEKNKCKHICTHIYTSITAVGENKPLIHPNVGLRISQADASRIIHFADQDRCECVCKLSTTRIRMIITSTRAHHADYVSASRKVVNNNKIDRTTIARTFSIEKQS